MMQRLSPSGDREAPWAQPKSGSKRADCSSTSRSPSGDRSLSSKDRWSRRRDSSPTSSPDRLSPLSKWLRAVSRRPGCRSCFHNDHWRSPGPRADQRMLRLRNVSPVPQQEDDPEADQNSSADDNRMSAEAVRKLFADFVCPPALSYYTDPFPDTDMTNTQLVPYAEDAVKSKTISDTEELDT